MNRGDGVKNLRFLLKSFLLKSHRPKRPLILRRAALLCLPAPIAPLSHARIAPPSFRKLALLRMSSLFTTSTPFTTSLPTPSLLPPPSPPSATCPATPPCSKLPLQPPTKPRRLTRCRYRSIVYIWSPTQCGKIPIWTARFLNLHRDWKGRILLSIMVSFKGKEIAETHS